MHFDTLRTVNAYHRAKFGDNISNSVRVIAIFRFSKWRSAAILDFVVAQKWHHGTLRAHHGQQYTKFGEDIWNSGWVMAIFLFQNGGLPPCWILLLAKNDVTAGCGLSMSITVPNLVTISRMAAGLLRFSVFKMAACRHLEFCCSPKMTSWHVVGSTWPPAHQIWRRYLK